LEVVYRQDWASSALVDSTPGHQDTKRKHLGPLEER